MRFSAGQPLLCRGKRGAARRRIRTLSAPTYRACRPREGKSREARNERHALPVLEDLVAAGAEGAEIGSRLDAIVEVRDRIPDVGFKQIAVRRVAIVQIECGDNDHDDVPVFLLLL
jgi:hypothetical protein